MIKVIAFDLVGVLVNEKDIELTSEEDSLERMFGDNINDSDYLIEARKIIAKDSIIMRITEELIGKLYKVKNENLFKDIKDKYHNLKIIIATNHVSFVRNFIGESFDINYLDDVLISAEIHKVKPHLDFYEHILNKFQLNPEELLFLDDNQKNIDAAKELGINTIKVVKQTDLFDEICEFIDANGW
ncbi:MAG TPA: HAD-IA family hydrolase [Candidatus Onthousia faecavium]|nr:HAD-IA family hydrolase [Candidatus Onthousia faecavium]